MLGNLLKLYKNRKVSVTLAEICAMGALLNCYTSVEILRLCLLLKPAISNEYNLRYYIKKHKKF